MLSRSNPVESDWSLYEKYRNTDDPSLFQEIFDRHKRNVLNLSYRFVRNRETAEDVAQDVFIKVYEKKARVDLNAKLSTWLYRVTVNASLDRLRKNVPAAQSLDAEREGLEENAGPLSERLSDPRATPFPDVLDQRELFARVREEINRLPDRLKAPLLLYQFDDLSYTEVARILHISPKAVERRLFRARERLRGTLEAYMT